MDCTNCELKQRQFYCENCLRTHIRDFRNQIQHFTSDRQEQVLKASAALEKIEPARKRRATFAYYQNRIDELLSCLSRLRRENDKKRDRLRELREGIAGRRRTLSAAKLVPQAPSNPAALREPQQLNGLSLSLAKARSGLVQELVEVFNVVEVGGRPPIGGKAGSKGEWTIGDLILPVPGDIRRYPPDHINAVITHTVHFLSLLTFYLGVKLPFEMNWSGGKLGVGQPSIGAIHGPEFGGWAKWHAKHPLHLSSNPSKSIVPPRDTESKATDQPSLSKQGSSSSNRSSTSPRRRSHSQTTIPISISMSESYMEHDPAPSSSFTTAIAMLLYNICYLAYTQNVDIPLNQAGDVLSNLWSVCCSTELGMKSHETTPRLALPTPPSFSLDFVQLLQATTANPTSRLRPRSGTSAKIRPFSTSFQGNKEAVIQEEDGWDLVDGGELGSDDP